jgi:hypothetical protein
MRKIIKSGPFTLFATDAPDTIGGACHKYEVKTDDGTTVLKMQIQQGPLKKSGPNGVPDILLAYILADRLEHFQKGPFASAYNAWGSSGVRTYLESQHARNIDREKRGVEGAYKI